MPEHLRILVPDVIADELVEDGIAVRPLGTRGPGMAESLSIAVDVINAGSALVSIGLAAAACRRLAETSLRRRGADEPDELTISITVGGESQSLSLDRTEPGAVDAAFDFFVAALDVE
jgi:hypothetical protein